MNNAIRRMVVLLMSAAVMAAGTGMSAPISDNSVHAIDKYVQNGKKKV